MATLREIRRGVAARLGPFAAGAATAASTTGFLVADAWPFKSTLSQDDLYADHYLFRPAAAAAGDATRLVATYTPSTGRFTPDQTWANAPALAEVFELHGIVPPVADGVNDLHGLINTALRGALLVVEATGTPVADAQRHSLGTIADWLEEPAWVYQVGWLGATEDRNAVDPFRRAVRGDAEVDGDTVYLNHPGRTFRADDVVYVRLLKPAFYHCRQAAGTWGAQSGLLLDTDETSAPLEWIVAATLVQAWLRLGNVLAPGDANRAQGELAKAAAQVTRFSRNYLESHLPRRSFRPLLQWGPRAWR